MAAGRMIYVTQVAPYRDGPAGVHGVLSQSAIAMAQLAEAAGLQPVHTTDVRQLDAEDLATADVVALFTIGETPWDAPQRTALVEGVRSGRTRLLGIHSATDSCYGWEEYGRLVGARFDGHPWTQEVNLQVCDPAHPAVAHLGPTWAWYDEVYRFRDLRSDAQVLLRVDQSRPDTTRPDTTGPDTTRPGPTRPDSTQPAPAPPPHGYPLSWCFQEGQGRVFSTSLGHFPAAWESVAFLRHLAGGLEWILADR